MHLRLVVLSLLFLGFTGCAVKTLPPMTDFVPLQREISYQEEVEPVLVKRCVVCHSCYNSPCQLKLSSWEGLDRGATKKQVYNALRRETMSPTRLFTDAENSAEWRAKGFQSVTENTGKCGTNDSIMLQMLYHKTRPENSTLNDGDEFKPEEDEWTCAEDGVELAAYLDKHPNRGMPYGFPPLTESEFSLVGSWLMQGAKGPTAEQQKLRKAVPSQDVKQVQMWEKFFNEKGAKSVMTSRYLYEHLYLAHLKMDTDSNAFYELVRSTTPPGEPIKIIATTFPYDPPDSCDFYYRLRKIHSTIVHKTHMVFALSEQKMKRWTELFLKSEWVVEPYVAGYKDGTNPFATFEQIPPKARYQFMLDNIRYIIMTFIRGPVCKGQVALNVVRDQFWLLFLDPEYDLAVQYPGFIAMNEELLEMPIMEESPWRLFVDTFLSKEFRHKSSQYVKKRQDFYAVHRQFQPLGIDSIWKGDKKGDTPILTVFRHFDSASVHEGPRGDLPRTIWVMDYPLLERIYYSLVAGFNVFGNRMHQASIRVYMDELRQEGETYFIDYMPKHLRHDMMQSWYGGMDIDKERIDYTPSLLESGFNFTTNDPKREFMEKLVETEIPGELGMGFDKNYRRAGELHPPLPDHYGDINDYIQGLRAISRPGAGFVTTVDNHNANLAYIRIYKDNNPLNDIYLTMVINRWHDDVTTLFGEGLRLNPKLDSAAFFPGFMGSYPNYFFEIHVNELPDFFTLLDGYDGSKEDVRELSRFGVNRGRKDFWDVYDRFQKKFNESDPVGSGLFDLNRYYYMVFSTEEDPQ